MSGTFDLRATSGALSDVLGRYTTQAGGGGGGTLRVAPTREWAFMLGPQVVPGTNPAGAFTAPTMTNMELQVAARRSLFTTALTEIPGYVPATGTVSVTNGSSAITGNGTSFGSAGQSLGNGIRIFDAAAGVWRYFVLSAVGSATSATIGAPEDGFVNGQAKPWAGASQGGLTYERTNPAAGPSSGLTMADQWGTLAYYDSVYVFYQLWLREDNCDPGSTWLASARAIMDNQARSAQFGEFAYPSSYGFGQPPRQAGLQGIMCRAHDGRPEWWPAIVAHLEFWHPIWLGRHTVGGPFATVPWNTRDGAYILNFLVCGAVLHPTSAQRAAWRDQAIAYAIDPCIRQSELWATAPGRRRFLNNINIDANGDGIADRSGDGCAGTPLGKGCAQDFQSSLAIEALINVHRMMRWHGLTADPRYATIGTAIVEACESWAVNYVDAAQGDALARSPGYFSGESTQTAVLGVPSAGVAIAPYQTPFRTLVGQPASYGIGGVAAGSDPFATNDARQLLATGLGNLAYARALTDSTTWRDRMVERYDACFGKQDGRRSDFEIGSQRNWNQHYRHCLKGLGFLESGLETF